MTITEKDFRAVREDFYDPWTIYGPDGDIFGMLDSEKTPVEVQRILAYVRFAYNKGRIFGFNEAAQIANGTMDSTLKDLGL